MNWTMFCVMKQSAGKTNGLWRTYRNVFQIFAWQLAPDVASKLQLIRGKRSDMFVERQTFSDDLSVCEEWQEDEYKNPLTNLGIDAARTTSSWTWWRRRRRWWTSGGTSPHPVLSVEIVQTYRNLESTWTTIWSGSTNTEEPEPALLPDETWVLQWNRILLVVHQSAVTSSSFFAVVWWDTDIKEKEAKRLNKLMKKAGLLSVSVVLRRETGPLWRSNFSALKKNQIKAKNVFFQPKITIYTLSHLDKLYRCDLLWPLTSDLQTRWGNT